MKVSAVACKTLEILRTAGLFLTVLSLVACMNDGTARNKLLHDGISVKVQINKLTYPSTGNVSYVHGRLSITSSVKRLISANLDCIALGKNELRSRKLYVDSMAHILTDAYEAKDNQIDVNVYWFFDKILNADDINELEIMLAKEYVGRERDCMFLK